uniref:Uncharacterized protein n=1 Tax=Anguilla anguilla TaxID=7936 RepID=A0A0E9T4R9_ANGAN
MKINTQPFGPD